MNERKGNKGENIYPHSIDMNVLPHIDVFMDNGYTKEEVKFVNKAGGQFRIPYRAIKKMEFSFYNPIESVKPSKHAAFNVKVGGKRYLTLRYDLGAGPESTVLSMEPDQYQQILGSFQSKTGMLVSRSGGYDKHW